MVESHSVLLIMDESLDVVFKKRLIFPDFSFSNVGIGCLFSICYRGKMYYLGILGDKAYSPFTLMA